jgi:hypothetical protein
MAWALEPLAQADVRWHEVVWSPNAGNFSDTGVGSPQNESVGASGILEVRGSAVGVRRDFLLVRLVGRTPIRNVARRGYALLVGAISVGLLVMVLLTA